MPLPQMKVHRHDRSHRTPITLVGEIDTATALLVRTAVAACVLDGVRYVDVDLTAATFCDAGGLNAFLAAHRTATGAGTALRLHCPPPVMARIIEITGSGFLLHEPFAVRPSPGRVPAAAGGAP